MIILDIILYTVLSIIFLAVLFRIGRYLSTPFLKKVGFYKYYSPMFLTMPKGRKILDIHLGTSWDFFKAQKQNPKLILYLLASGLVKFCDAIEKGKIPKDTLVQGNIFYLRDTSVEKFGFKYRKMNWFETILFVINYIELSILISISYKRFRTAPLNNVKIIYNSAEELLKNRDKYQKTADMLKKSMKINDRNWGIE